jgi:hypothetical protein
MTSPILVKLLSTSQILMAQIYPLKMVMFHSYSRYIYLVGGLESWNFAWLSHNNWECHHPNWRTHIFRRGRYTTNQCSNHHFTATNRRRGRKGLAFVLRQMQGVTEHPRGVGMNHQWWFKPSLRIVQVDSTIKKWCCLRNIVFKRS